MDVIGRWESPLGGMTLAGDGEGLVGLWFDGQKHFGATLSGECREGDLPVFDETRRWLELYFSGREPGFTPGLSLRATPFRRAVWELLMEIPYGQTATYGEIAARLSEKGPFRASARAVGGAVGHNPISLIIPCHRVIGADGSLTGYAGGLERKRCLLRLEASGGNDTQGEPSCGGRRA